MFEQSIYVAFLYYKTGSVWHIKEYVKLKHVTSYSTENSAKVFIFDPQM